MTELTLQSESALARVNQRLARLTGIAPAPLATGGGQALADTLWIWGIVGGKDVGKSTLINALAGGDVVDRGVDVGAGTDAPSAYLHARDRGAAEQRFAGQAVRYVADAPAGLRGLVLVDLPDFDSLFAEHLARVRDIVHALDGIIWVTTPKKIGDLRAIEEIQRMLKARMNFVYVVNKMDWLIGQSDRPPADELTRAESALRQQVASCDDAGPADRAFLVAARYGAREAMLTAIARQRRCPPNELNGALASAVDTLLENFGALRQRLTTPPTGDSARANKQANLAFQLRAQAATLRKHFAVDAQRARLDRALANEALAELAAPYFGPAYVGGVLARLNAADMRFPEWSGKLFRRRIARWPLLGWIAWPAMALAGALGGLRALLPRMATAPLTDPFRDAGIDLEERADGLLAALRARLTPINPELAARLPAADAVAQRFRGDATAVAQAQADAILTDRLARSGGVLGRIVRGGLTVGILLWFPVVQPLLALSLGAVDQGELLSVATLADLTAALSGSTVLTGLTVAVLLLIMLTGGVYSRAVAETYRALDALGGATSATAAGPLSEAVARSAAKSALDFRADLADIAETLSGLADASPAVDPEPARD
jgi:hypothetical protein